jgi:hypothetical protein
MNFASLRDFASFALKRISRKERKGSQRRKQTKKRHEEIT